MAAEKVATTFIQNYTLPPFFQAMFYFFFLFFPHKVRLLLPHALFKIGLSADLLILWISERDEFSLDQGGKFL